MAANGKVVQRGFDAEKAPLRIGVILTHLTLKKFLFL